MFAETNYYQISGYRAHSNGWFKKFDDKPITQAITTAESRLFRPGGKGAPVELVLGILPCGTSYLLMTSEQMLEFTHEHRLNIPRNPWKAAEFLSLSPIYFDSLNELAAKIATYKQVARNKNRREPEKEDNSKANRGYGKKSKDIDRYRGIFEHQRILYRLLTKDLEPGKVGLAPPSWLGCVRVLSLVLVEWGVDNRAKAERQRDPLLVEVGWTEATFPSFFERLTGATVHFRLDTNKKNATSRNPHFSEVVKGDQAELYSRLRSLFRHDANKSGIPLIVLVHNEDMARDVLARAGIDTDAWSSGLSELLTRASAPARRYPTYKVEEDPPRLDILPEPCIVETRKLVDTLMRDSAGDRDAVPHTARRLRMQTNTNPCAGDDSLLQLRMWTSMAQGPAIDEQRQRRSTLTPVAQVLAPPAQQPVNADGDGDDVDPNDFAPNFGPAVPYDFSDEDDDW